MKELPTAEYLRECFDYDPETGILTWKVRPLHHFSKWQTRNIWNGHFAGKIVGRPNRDGHVTTTVDARPFPIHRLIWRLMTGQAPKRLDHKNGNPADNRWDNLREATIQQNRWNMGHDGHLPKGVRLTRYGRRYWAELCITKEDGRRGIKHLGTFDTPEEAHAAWCEAARQQRGEFFRAE